MKIGVLASGKLGNDILNKISLKYEIVFVLTDSHSEEIIKLCSDNNIPCFKGNPRHGKAYNFIKHIETDIIASINYLFLIEQDIINHSNKLSFNIHGSLLPKYRGRTPHVWAIINNEKTTGITAHVIDEGCDTGDIISQIIIPIENDDTGGIILEKYKKQYFKLVENVFEQCKKDSINLIKQENELSTYFGKRTPVDGQIDWNWQKERIRNWARAQSAPYPGAFSIIKNQKLIIDFIEDSPMGYHYNTENGTLLAVTPNIIVKTSNGALEITKLRNSIKVAVGDKLN